MFEVLTNLHNRDNDDIENFGYRADTVQPSASHSTDTLPGIPGSSYQTVGMKLCSGLLNQPKMLPLKYMPLTIELELVNDANDAIVTPGVDTIFTTANTTNDWQLENVQIKCDIFVTFPASMTCTEPAASVPTLEYVPRAPSIGPTSQGTPLYRLNEAI